MSDRPAGDRPPSSRPPTKRARKAADPTNAAATPPDVPKPSAPAKPVIKRVRKTVGKAPDGSEGSK